MQKQSRDAIYDASNKYLHGYVIELCKTHLLSYPNDGCVWIEYGMALTQLSRFEEAENAFDQAVVHCPESLHSFIFARRGQLNRRRGNNLEAEKWYLRAIEVSPKELYSRIFLGICTFRRGDLKLAEKRLREAIECGGDVIDEAYLNLGGVLVAQERYEEAARCYERAIEIDPQYKQAKLRLRDVKKILACTK